MSKPRPLRCDQAKAILKKLSEIATYIENMDMEIELLEKEMLEMYEKMTIDENKK